MFASKRCLCYVIKIILLLSLNINASLFYLLPYSWSFQYSDLFVSKMKTCFNPHMEQANLLVGARYEKFYLLKGEIKWLSEMAGAKNKWVDSHRLIERDQRDAFGHLIEQLINWPLWPIIQAFSSYLPNLDVSEYLYSNSFV